MRFKLRMGGELILEEGVMRLDPARERRLAAHLERAELYSSRPPPDGLTFRPPIAHPPHEHCVEIEVDLASGSATAEALGADRSHEYVTENADYRS
jgi:glutamate N-acetyltransferase/amino-acid N-acetyltransferase